MDLFWQKHGAETRLIDLQFKDINITSTSESVGIMANVLENINVIRNVEIENCSIISTSENMMFM